MEKEIKLSEELIPMSKKQLQDLEIHTDLLAQMGAEYCKYAAGIGDVAMMLSMDDAAKLMAKKNVHNIRNSSTAIAQYFGLIRMLVSNIKDDLQEIEEKRKEYARGYSTRMSVVINKPETTEQTDN